MDRLPGSRRKKRAFLLAALAVASTACVSVPDDIKATFALPTAHETDNFAVNAPHGHAPKDDPITKPLLPGMDASAPLDATADASKPMAEIFGMCASESTASTAADASPLDRPCTTDAGTR